MLAGEQTIGHILWAEKFTVAGRYVAYVRVEQWRGSYLSSAVFVANGKTGRVRGEAKVGNNEGLPEGEGTGVGRLVVNARGNAAWQTYTVTTPTDITFGVWLRDARGLRQLADTPTTVSDLTLGVSSVRWTQGGVRHSVRLRP